MEKIISELKKLDIKDFSKIEKIISQIKLDKVKSIVKVGDRVYVVQKTKKRAGTVMKINNSKAIVNMVVSPITGETADYSVPFSMLQKVS
ncbi:MAG: hypothetical protein CMC84_01135 [Flavobacteriaceae bacterium]|nr:hypothetical protein [Flavobacteriaceae bacterium]|tara:strand:+ start:1412 stop:1681 length:270 start_codon:yes stop_codon:yes gene_type:complete